MGEQLNLRHVEVFRVVLQFGSMTKAAEVLGVSQPAVSRLMNVMGEAVGFPLFRREGGVLVPTEDAALLRDEIELTNVGLNLIRERADAIRGGMAGRVQVVAMAHYANELLPSIIAAFLAQNRHVQVELDVHPRAQIADQVSSRRAEIGLVGLPTHSAGLKVERLLARNAVALLPAESPLTELPVVSAEDLDGQPFIAFRGGTPLRYEIDAILSQRQIRPDVVVEATTHEAVCAFVAAGAGISVVGPYSDWTRSDPRLVVRPFSPALPIEIGLLSPESGLSAIAQRLRDHIAAHFRDQPTRY